GAHLLPAREYGTARQRGGDIVWPRWFVEMRGDIADFVEERIRGVTGAIRGVDVAMAEDSRQGQSGTVGDPGERAPGRGQRGGAFGIDALESKPPADQPADGAQLDRRRRHVVEIADHRHTPGFAVESAGVGALDRFGDSTGPALEYLAVLVHQRV